MLRASSPTALSTLRQSLLPTLSLSSSSSSLHIFSTFPSFSSLSSKSLQRNSVYLSSLCFRRLPSLMDPACPRGIARASFSAPESSSKGERELLLQHLLVKEDDLNLLLDIHHRVARGEDLGDLAVEYSICPSKEEGGMLGWVRKGQMVPEFEDAAFGAPLNKVVRCKTKFGWHLLQVLSEREESTLQDIPPSELHVKMQDPQFVDEAQLIDVREPEEVAQASLPSFQVLPLRQFGSWGPEIMNKFDPLKDTYVMCHHGMRSLQVAKWLQTQGFRKVFNVAGGIHAYATNVDQSIPTY